MEQEHRSCKKCLRPLDRSAARGMCNRCWMNYRNRMIAYGKWEYKYTDIGPVIEHLHKLRATGLGARAIHEMTRLPRLTTQKLSQPGRTKCARKTADAILSISVPECPHGEELAPGVHVPALGTNRRLQGLAMMGYTLADLGERLGGIKIQQVSLLQNGKQTHVTVKSARAVEALFNELQLIPGPSEQTRKVAAKKGYLPPFSWDEDTIDDPAATLPSPEVDTDWLGRYEELVDMGIPPQTAAKRLDVKWDTVKTRLRRMEKRAA